MLYEVITKGGRCGRFREESKFREQGQGIYSGEENHDPLENAAEQGRLKGVGKGVHICYYVLTRNNFV